MSAPTELWQRRITHEEYVRHGDDWKRVGEGHCATCGREGNLFRRPIDNPGMLSCAHCRDSIRRAYKRLTNADDPPRSQGEIEEKKFERLIELPDDLHDAKGRPISQAVEAEDEAKLSLFIERTRSEPRCSACGQPEWHPDHHGQIHNADMRHHLFQKADQ